MHRISRRELGPRARGFGLLTAFAFTLGACQSYSLSDLDPFSSSEPQPCPPAATLSNAETIIEFGRTQSEAESNIIHQAEIQRTIFDCQIAGTSVTGTIGVVGKVTLGQKGREGNIALPIFIALTRSSSEVLSKRFDTVEVTVARGETTANFEKVITGYSFDLAGQQSLSYEILAGFNLTPEQIAYNRKRSGG